MLRLGELRPRENGGAVRRQCRTADVRETPRLPLEQSPHAHPDDVQCRFGRQAIVTGSGGALEHRPLQRGDPDHEELVEIRADDRQEADPSEHRHAWIFRQGQDARVELEQAQIAVQEVLGAEPVEIGHRRPEREVRQPNATLRPHAR